jgi:hypothetical protein
MKLGKNIARNSALRENVFMMIVCISLRIPLFLIGKPGSSKSLAKSIILNSMRGTNSESKLLKIFKEVQLFSYQCSQLSTSDTILKVFRQATNVQNKWDKSKYVAVVVLDEIGLAEDSPNLPLKTLHPLLEDGTEGNKFTVDIVNREERVAFIGISNWALDPAKMNRGVMIIRGNLSLKELQETALQICDEKDINQFLIEPLKSFFNFFAAAYLEVLEKQKGTDFYGLRDFYSLIKMLFWMCKSVNQPPNSAQIEHVILRNFSGNNDTDILDLFRTKIPKCPPPNKSLSREKCEVLQRSVFKRDKYIIIKNLLFDLFINENLHKHEEEFQKLNQSKFTLEDYQKKQFDCCCENGDFESDLLNEKFENAFQDYYNQKFEQEVKILIK